MTLVSSDVLAELNDASSAGVIELVSTDYGLRANQIFVVGDVVDPGAKQISSAGRVLDALQAAGGPNVDGVVLDLLDGGDSC